MDQINIQFFYGVGFALGRLETVAASEAKLNNWRWSNPLESATGWMKCCTEFEDHLLPKTKRAATVLFAELDKFTKVLGQDRKATSEEIEAIHRGIPDFYKVFEQEIEDANCYIVTPVGAYAISALLDNAVSHLSQPAQRVVSGAAKKDFNLAGKCLALDLYTACGFHAMRAVEAEARLYHEDVTGVELVDVPIGTLIYGDLKNHPNSGLKTQHAKEGGSHESQLGLIISLLSQMNTIYRRPLMHPDMLLGQTSAKVVFDTAAIAISTMAADKVVRWKAAQTAANP